MHKKLYRSREHRVFLGLCGGVAQYFDVDPILVRLISLVVTVLTGVFPGILAYLLGVLIVPLEPLIAPAESRVVDEGNESAEV